MTQKRITSWTKAVDDHVKYTQLKELKKQITAYHNAAKVSLTDTTPDDVRAKMAKKFETRVQQLTADTLAPSHKAYQINRMARRMVKQLRKAPLDVDAATKFVDAEIAKTRMGQYAWTVVNDLPTKDDVIAGKLRGKGSLITQFMRPPILDAAAMVQAQLCRENVPGQLQSVSAGAKALIESLGSPGADMLQQAGMKMSYGPELAAHMNMDFDGDIGHFWTRSLHYLKGVAEHVGMSLEDIDELGLTDVSRQTDMDALKAMCKYYAMHKDETGTFRPTSPTSFTAMFDIAKAQENEYLKYKSMNEFIDERVDMTLLPVGDKEKMRHELKQSLKQDLKKPLRSLFVYEGRNEEKYLEHLTATAPNLDPASLTESTFNGWTHAQFAQYQTMQEQEKRAYADAVIDYERRTAPRLNAMKKLTPDAFNLSKAFTALEPYLLTDESRTFLHAFSNKLVAQKAISMKHGTFPVVDDLKKLMAFARADTPVDDGLLQRLSEFNFEWTPRDPGSAAFVETVKTVSGIADAADQSADSLRMKQYASYLEKKTTYLSSMMDIHATLEASRVDMVTKGYSADRISKKYKTLFHKEVKSNGIDLTAASSFELSEHGLTNAAFVRMQHADAQEQLRNLKDSMQEKHLVKNGATAPGDTAYMRRNLNEVVAALKRYENTTGYTPLDHPAIRMVRQFDSSVENANVLQAMAEHHDAVISSNVAERHLARTASQLHRADTELGYMNNDQLSYTDISIRDAENRAAYRMKQSAIAQSSTPFRYGSIGDTISGKLARAGVSAEADRMADAIIKHRGKLALAGLFIGAVASQVVNTVSTGYAAPGLDNINGKGGEYYEHHTRIIGTELEGILAPQPVRMVNQYRESISMMKQVMTAQSARGAYDGRPTAASVAPSYKGVWV